MDPDRRPRRHGRRAAAGRDDGRRLAARGRMPAQPHRDAPAHRLSRRAGRQTSTRRWRSSSAPCSEGKRGLGRAARQRGRSVSRTGAARRAARRRHRPDLGARSAQRLSAEGLDAATNGRRAASAIRRRSSARRARRWPSMCARCSSFTQAGVPTVDYGNNIRQMAKEEGVADAFDFPGFVPAYIRPLFCRGIGPFRWAALSGDPEDIYRTDAQGEGAAARRHASAQLARHGARAHQLPGPAGAHLLGRARRPPSRSASPSTRWWRAAN